MADTEDGKLDVEEVMAEMRALIGEQGQQIAMLRAALTKARRPQGANASPPVPGASANEGTATVARST